MSVMEQFESMSYGPALEDPREALTWLDAHQRSFAHFIGGEWHPPAEGGYFTTTDPSTGDALAQVAQGSAADIGAAVAAARRALAPWQALSPNERARFLYALA